MQNRFELADIEFGHILNHLLESGTITDIEIRSNGVWTTDITKGRTRLDTSGFTPEQIDEFYDIVGKLPQQLSHRMVVNYNEGNPILDAEAIYKNKGLLRINAIHETITGNSAGIAIRLTPYNLRLSRKNILNSGYAPRPYLWLMKALIKAGCNSIFAGITGAGKTEALKFFARYIPPNDAIITIEDTREAYLELLYPQKDVLALKSSETQNFEHLIRASLRQNPDWILVSEARGREILELNEAVGTGHKIITTIHSDGVMNIPYRMVDMAKVDGQEADRLFRQIHNNIDVGAYIHYFNDEEGSHRKITEVAEYYIDEDNKPVQHMICEFDYQANDYVYHKIESPKIIRKLMRSKTDTGRMKGLFL
ncbi:MAG: Flp pilus assembly complex ATPase component TadA [Erysipelotrichaceae bacterium]|nr:Flp pilus assembly complex ATPase component TadA [Erysipelotrichaceae bacterium]